MIWPFGRSIEMRRTAGVASVIGNIIWILLFGWELALGHLTAGILLCITIIGIPLGLANFKLIPISLRSARRTGSSGRTSCIPATPRPAGRLRGQPRYRATPAARRTADAAGFGVRAGRGA